MLAQKNVNQDIWAIEFLDYLLLQMLISPEDKEVLQKKISLGEAIDDLLPDYLPEEEVLNQKSAFLGIKRVHLSSWQIKPDIALLIPEELALKYTLIPYALEEGRLLVAMANPVNRKAWDDVSFYTGYQVEPYLAGAEEIKLAIRNCFTVNNSTPDSEITLASYSSWKISEEDAGREAPVIRLVDSLFRQAIKEQASDIHWEPQENCFKIKFRIDGLLEVKATLPLGMARSVVARLKLMAGMDVTERRLPQDGRIMLEVASKTVDIRVSSLTTVYGEKIVTRILDQETARRSLAELGMRPEVEEGVRKLLRLPFGLILVSGPTGSGKTTTLYALLRELQSETLNIVSIEDPVEYRLPGVNQAQVNTRIGLDFAAGLRAILRQDPDIIMVGEIRDKETARIATAAALTGHLVLSTVHTNTAAEALARLLDMDIDPYLVAASICGVISQRLLRKLCPFCREPRPVSAQMKETFNLQNVEVIYGAKGCPKCRGTGYLGRIGIHEFLPYNQEIKELVLKKSSSALLEKTSRALGMITLQEDALLKVVEGYTSLEEAMRLIAGI
ncbi:MAG TPA: type II/IV secretion system protein [Peptococcaceae bacterium]|nr:type II/IV secretion system protein [Peptococcaceae bacterium]